MTDAGCPHGMPSPASCIDCMDEGLLPPPPKPEVPEPGHSFEAAYPGHCKGCDLPIHPGQRITAMTDGTYRHEGWCAGR